MQIISHKPRKQCICESRGETIVGENSVKLLGIQIDNNLDFNEHYI